MFRKFGKDRSGNYAMLTALAMLPVMGAVTLAVDYSEVSRQRQAAQNALDATNLAIALSYLDGTEESQVRAFAQDYFEANFRPSKTADPTVSVTFPSSDQGGGTLKTCADLKYEPVFYPVVQMLTQDSSDSTIDYTVCTEVRLKNTLEVALVLDNSGSMDFRGFGSGKKRIDLLKEAARQLVDTLAGQAGLMQQVAKPVQFGLVPFAASVNVGPQYGPQDENASWLDTDGLSSVHHENFEWESMEDRNKNKRVEQDGRGVYRKEGRAWNHEEGEKVTRFTLYDNQHHIDWEGCVEVRPYPHNVNGTIPDWNDPDTLFVPMFAPDETDRRDDYNRLANNSWLNDETNAGDRERQEYMPKYFNQQSPNASGLDRGPNIGCTTAPITPLTDVTASDGLKAIKSAIDAMSPLGATNVPQGIGWGWHVVSNALPFTEGREDDNKGNDKVVIVLTDGANTYYRPESIGIHRYDDRWPTRGNDLAENESTYSAYAYASEGRIFAGTGVSGFHNDNYSRAMNKHMAELCENAKDEDIILMTVALDLDKGKRDELEQIETLEECASVSRFRTGEDGDPVKLFWNTKGDELTETFKEIADELSNLRLVS